MKLIRIITILVAVSITLSSLATARDFSYADAVTFIGTEGAGKNLKKAVFAAQLPGDQTNQRGDDDWAAIGTGFFMQGKKKTLFAVTCKHVVEAAKKAKKQLFAGVETGKGYRRFPCKLVYKDPDHDIAILVLKYKGTEDINIQNIVFPKDMIDDGSSIVEGRGVLITGYPLSLGIEDDKNHPVIRFGIIAQNTGQDIFLVDGFASHGNSGSPVFALKYKEQKLVGMVTSHITDNITLFNDNGQLSARLPYNSGLARVLNARIINTAINRVNENL